MAEFFAPCLCNAYPIVKAFASTNNGVGQNPKFAQRTLKPHCWHIFELIFPMGFALFNALGAMGARK